MGAKRTERKKNSGSRGVTKKSLLALLLALILLVVSGCSSSDGDLEEGGQERRFSIYCLNLEEEEVNSVAYGEDDETPTVEDLLHAILIQPEDVDYVCALPAEVDLNSYDLRNGTLGLDFNDAYLRMGSTREVLARAAIVLTMCQLDEVERVHFTVEGEELSDSYGAKIGDLTADDFFNSDGAMINNYQISDIVLFFANAEGTGLEREEMQVRYSTSMPLEKRVMECLMEGPRDDNHIATIPDGTQLLSVTIRDNICYVNLSSDFINQEIPASPKTMIYSIVNSISQSTGADMVQFAIDGKNDVSFQDIYLSAPISPDYDL